MRNTYKNTKEGDFYSFSKTLKTSIIIFYKIAAYHAHIQYFIKYAYIIFVMDVCII